MRKITNILLTALLLAVMLTVFLVPTFADNEPTASGLCGGDGEVHWELYDDTATLRIWGHGNMKDYDDYDETPWYEYDASNTVKHIVVEDGITSVGAYAFAKFYYVEDISLGKDVFRIHDYAFWEATYYSEKDVNLVIPSTTYEIREGAFYKAMHLKTVNIKSDRDTYPWYVTDEWKIQGLEIGKHAFYDCENIETLTVGNIEKANNMTIRIGYASFENCESLNTIHFADSLNTIDEAAFCDCPALRNIYYYGSEAQFANVSISDEDGWNTDLFNVINEVDGRHIYYLVVGEYIYIDENGNTATLDGTKVKCQILDSSIKELTGGWYIVDSNISYWERIYVTADSNILLLDNCGIETSRGIGVNNTKLGIYAQSSDENTMGYINVTTSDLYCAGIGTGKGVKDGTVMICGGNINAAGGNGGSGIGSGREGNCKVIITGGIVTGRGGLGAAGIGSGDSTSKTTEDSDCTVTITGGIVIGYGGDSGAGIGSGNYADSTVNIYAGIVTGYGGDSGAGIGSGRFGDSSVCIYGGTVTATGGNYAAGIGSGCGNRDVLLLFESEQVAGNGLVKIYGGTIYAYGGCVGIGSGEASICGVRIIGGNISGDIGSGSDGHCSIAVPDKAFINGINGTVGVGDPGTCDIYDVNGKTIGSFISEGNLTIIVSIATAAIIAIATIVILKKKQNS